MYVSNDVLEMYFLWKNFVLSGIFSDLVSFFIIDASYNKYLISINIFLIIDLKEKKKSITNLDLRNNKRKEISINLTIILMTILFILFTSPSAICSQFYGQLISSYNGTIILYVSDCIAFSYHALNIIILCLVNKSFLRRLKIVLGLAKEEEEEERDNNQENNLNQDNNINRFSISHFF